MDEPLVSIIIPCFNGERCVAKAIQSALAQTYPAKEIIVIDDGSTDGSLEVVRSFADRIRVLAEPHCGGGAARNRGLAEARGEYIQFLDADDLLHPDKLTRQMAVVRQRRADIVFCDYQIEAAPGAPLRPHRKRRYDGQDPVIFLLTHQLWTSTPLHPKKLLEAVGGFDETLPCSQEYDLHLRLACAGATFYHCRETLCTWRQTAGSVSSDVARVHLQQPRILQRAYRLLLEAGTLTPERQRAFAECLAGTGRYLLREGRREEGRACFAEAARMHESGGLGIYRRPARLLVHALGPERTERLSLWWRRQRSHALP